MDILLVAGPGISLKEPYNSGIEAFIVSLANQLMDEGHVVNVVADNAEPDAKFKVVNPFKSSASDRSNFFKRIKETFQFRKLDVSSYDIIHYNMFYPHLLKAGLHFKKKSLLTLHSPVDKKRTSVYKKLFRQGNITFVAISERVKQHWDQALGMDLPLINNGINIDIWPTKKPEDRDYLLWSARINAKKNVAAAISLAIEMQLPLKIAGRITDQQYFDEAVKPYLNDRIKYVGHVTQRELSTLASKASAYLATATWQEPFGLAALEMLASGVPVIGFNTAVPPDWLHESVLTTASLRWQDLTVLLTRSKDISPGSCKEFASNMNIQNMASQYILLYRQMLMQNSTAKELANPDDLQFQIVSRQTQTVQ